MVKVQTNLLISEHKCQMRPGEVHHHGEKLHAPLYFQVLCFSSFFVFLTSALVVYISDTCGIEPAAPSTTRKVFLPWLDWEYLLDNCEHKHADQTEVLLPDLWRHAGQRLCFLVLSLLNSWMLMLWTHARAAFHWHCSCSHIVGIQSQHLWRRVQNDPPWAAAGSCGCSLKSLSLLVHEHWPLSVMDVSNQF